MDRGVFVRRDLTESTTLRELLERYAAEVVPGSWPAKSATFIASARLGISRA
jgi:hypothetical protein